MTDYQAQAKQFLTDCNATMEINLGERKFLPIGKVKPNLTTSISSLLPLRKENTQAISGTACTILR